MAAVHVAWQGRVSVFRIENIELTFGHLHGLSMVIFEFRYRTYGRLLNLNRLEYYIDISTVPQTPVVGKHLDMRID